MKSKISKLVFIFYLSLIGDIMSGQSIKQIIHTNTITLNDSIQGLWIEDFIIAPSAFFESDEHVVKISFPNSEITPNDTVLNIEKKIVICEKEFILIPFKENSGSEYIGNINIENSDSKAGNYYLINWDSNGAFNMSTKQYTVFEQKNTDSIFLMDEGSKLKRSGFLLSLSRKGLKQIPLIQLYYSSDLNKTCTIGFQGAKSSSTNDFIDKTESYEIKSNIDNHTKGEDFSLIDILENDKGAIKRFYKNGLFGYMVKGVVIVPAKYIYAEPFRKGKATVCESEENCYTINQEGICIKHCK